MVKANSLVRKFQETSWVKLVYNEFSRDSKLRLIVFHDAAKGPTSKPDYPYCGYLILLAPDNPKTFDGRVHILD